MKRKREISWVEKSSTLWATKYKQIHILDILWCEVADQIGRQKMACKFQQNLEWFLKTSSFDISGIGMKTDSSHIWPFKGHPKKPNTRRKGVVAFGCVTTPPPNSKDFSFFPFLFYLNN